MQNHKRVPLETWIRVMCRMVDIYCATVHICGKMIYQMIYPLGKFKHISHWVKCVSSCLRSQHEMYFSIQLFCSRLWSEVQEKKKCKSLSPSFDALYCGLKLLFKMCKHILPASGPGFFCFAYFMLEPCSRETDLDSAETQPAPGNVYCSYGCTVGDGTPA